MRLTGGRRPRMEAEEMEQGQGKGEREGDLVKEAKCRAGTKCLLKMKFSVDWVRRETAL